MDDYRKEAYVQPITLRLGMTHHDVGWLRECLRLQEPDLTPTFMERENFDAGLDAAVSEFQRRCGLTVDGVVGAKTWGAFFEWTVPKVPFDTRISPHLAVWEVIDMRAQRDQKASWRVLYKPVLAERFEKMRAAAGVPIRINSGDRTPTTNGGLGAVGNSRHLYGHAIDFSVPGKTNVEHFELAKAAGFNGVANYDPRKYSEGFGHGDLGLASRAWRTWTGY